MWLQLEPVLAAETRSPPALQGWVLGKKESGPKKGLGFKDPKSPSHLDLFSSPKLSGKTQPSQPFESCLPSVDLILLAYQASGHRSNTGLPLNLQGRVRRREACCSALDEKR